MHSSVQLSAEVSEQAKTTATRYNIRYTQAEVVRKSLKGL